MGEQALEIIEVVEVVRHRVQRVQVALLARRYTEAVVLVEHDVACQRGAPVWRRRVAHGAGETRQAVGGDANVAHHRAQSGRGRAQRCHWPRRQDLHKADVGDRRPGVKSLLNHRQRGRLAPRLRKHAAQRRTAREIGGRQWVQRRAIGDQAPCHGATRRADRVVAPFQRLVDAVRKQLITMRQTGTHQQDRWQRRQPSPVRLTGARLQN